MAPSSVTTPPQHIHPSPKHHEYLQWSVNNCDNQSNGRKNRYSIIECRLTTEHDRNGENGRILLLFFDDPPKILRQIQQHHCLKLSMHDESSERIKGKDGETMTKIEKRKRTKPTCGRPFQSVSSGLVSQRLLNQYQHRKHQYIRHFNTVVMNVNT
jgi:hypothetical protein